MKKKLLTTFGFILGALYGSAQSFTAGNLAVYRYGNGAAALSNSQTVPVFIDEYTPAGVLVKSRAIPATDNGANFKLTGLGRDADGKYVNEGISTLSQDGKYLTIFGYNQTVGGAVPTTANGLVVGVIAADGSYNSSTTLSNDAATGLGSPRSAVIDGTTNIWANGSQNGIQYTTLGASSSIRVSTGQDASKSLSIAKTWASGVLGTARLYAATAAASTELPYATPLPTTSTTFTTSTPFNEAITANQVVVLTVENRTIIYAVDDAANTIRRYYLNYGGGAIGPFSTLSDANTTKIKSITAKVRGRVGTKTVVDVYATAWGGDGTGTETSKLLTFTDSYLTTNPTDVSQVELATTTTLLATAPANTLFKSVSLVPSGSTTVGTAVLPVNLTSFGAKKSGSEVTLSWTTLSEKNNSHFDVLHSENGNDFTNIGKVTGSGNSDRKVNYSFTDKSPAFGANYYRLNQVDFDGKTSPSETVAVNFGFVDHLSIAASQLSDNSGLAVAINSPAIIEGEIKVFTINGQQVAALDAEIQKGRNSFSIPAKVQPGVYVITLSTTQGKISQKISVR